MTKMSILKRSFLCTLLVTSTFSFSKTLDSIAVVVNDDVVTQQELSERVALVKDQYKANPSVLPNDEALAKQVLDALILESLQLQMAKRGNLVIPEQQIDTALTNIAKNQKMTLPQFLSALQNSGQNVDAFRKKIRDELMINELQKQIVGRQIFISESEIERFLTSQSGQSLKETEYRLSYMRFEQSQKVQAEALRDKLNTGTNLLDEPDAKDLGMRKLADVPSIFKTLVPVLNQGEAILIDKNGSLHLTQLAKKTEIQSVNIEEYEIRHILIKTDALFDAASARSLLSDLKNQIESGTSMADLADQYTQDVGTKGTGGILSWSSLDNYVSEFSQVAKAINKDEISEVFKSPYGYHILRVEGVRTRDVGLDVLRNQIRSQLSQRRYTESLQRWLTELRAESYIEFRP